MSKKMYSDREVLEKIRECASRVNGHLTKDEFKELGGSPQVAERRFGGWVSAKQEAGVPVNLGGEVYTDQYILDKIREINEKTNGKLTLKEFQNETAISRTAVRRFGSWNEAKQEAGVSLNPTSTPTETGGEYLSRIKRWAFCQNCGFDSEPAIDFHHVSEFEKEFEIAKNDVKKASRRFEELQKCIPLCANCHRLHHSDNYDVDAGELDIPDYPNPRGYDD